MSLLFDNLLIKILGVFGKTGKKKFCGEKQQAITRLMLDIQGAFFNSHQKLNYLAGLNNGHSCLVNCDAKELVSFFSSIIWKTKVWSIYSCLTWSKRCLNISQKNGLAWKNPYHTHSSKQYTKRNPWMEWRKSVIRGTFWRTIWRRVWKTITLTQTKSVMDL